MRIDRKKIKTGKRIVIVTVLAVALSVPLAVDVTPVRAAEIEDCDLDGYDDHTGNPVPWIGFDSTKGQEIPSGWDGHTTYKSQKAYEDAQKKDSGTEKKEETPKEDKAGSTAEKPGSTADQAGQNSTGSAQKTVSSQKTAKTSVGSSTQSKTKGSKKKAAQETTKTAKKTTVKDKKKDTKDKTQETKKEEKTSEEKKPFEKKSKKGPGKEKTQQDITQSAALQEEQPETDGIPAAVLDTGSDTSVAGTGTGSLDIREEDGSAIHAGGSLVIHGSGFVGNVNDLELEIHSEKVVNLGTTATSEDGSFEKVVTIPEDLEEGFHDIVVKYQGQEIATQNIKVGPKVADTFFKALTAGFSAQNKGLLPGILILTGLFAAGAAALLVNAVRKKGKAA